MEAESLTHDCEAVHIVVNRVLAFIKDGQTKLEQAIVEVRAILLILKVPVIGIVPLGKMIMIGTLELFLNDWVNKRKLSRLKSMY